jgi:hypothetical protein
VSKVRKGWKIAMTEAEREQLHRSDLEKINLAADYLNSEAQDVLLYQAEINFDELDHEIFDKSTVVGFTEADLEK